MVRTVWEFLLVWLLATGVADFIMMGVDKSRAVHGELRISERTLLVVGLVGGWWGLLLGMYAFHHKSSKVLFVGAALVITAIWLFILQRLVEMFGPPFIIPGI